MSDHYQTPGAHITSHDEVEYYQPKWLALSGRIGRLRWMAYNMGLTLVFYFLLGLSLAFLGDSEALMNNPEAFKEFNQGTMGVAFWVLYLVFLVFSLGFTRRRLNDVDRTGWLMLVMLIPLVNLILVLYLLFAPGTHGRNRFGPAPNENPAGIVVLAFLPLIVAAIGVIAAIVLPIVAGS